MLTNNSINSTNKSRILLIDGLRGFSLLGIVLAHVNGWFIAGAIPSTVYLKFQHSFWTSFTEYFGGIFIEGKFYTLFSFLFGLSFALQMFQKKDTDPNFTLRFCWRLVILFVIGFIHHLHWKGDILGIYAFLGFFMLLFKNATDKILWIGILCFILNLPGIFYNFYQESKPKEKPKTEKEQKVEQEKYEKETIQSYETLKNGSYLAIIKQNFKDFKFKIDFQINSGRLCITFGFFLLGLWVGRKRFFENFENYKPSFKKIMWICLIANVLIIGFLLTLILGGFAEKMPNWMNTVINFIFSLHSILMTVFYIVAISLLLNLPKMHWWLDMLSAVGKMGLTNYLTQSILGVMIFYGFGLKQAGNFHTGWCYLIGISIFIFQVIFSKWWLSRYIYGPMEWLWRSGTYLKWQKMLR
jgi:uncharacterized protein